MPKISLLNRLARHPVLIMVAVVCALLAAVVMLSWEFGARGLRISVKDSTEASNRTLTRVFVNENWDAVKALLPPPGSSAEPAQSNPNIEAIDQIVRRFSSYTDVLKVKIYDLGGMTVYSSERRQIGEDKARNPGFQAAARGGVVSEMTHRGTFGGFDGELYERNLVSTYVPVRVGAQVEAVLEIYADRTDSIEFINRELRSLALEMAPWIVAALLAVAVVGWWLHRAQLTIIREMARIDDPALRQATETTASKVDAGATLGRLPPALDGLDALLVRVQTAVPPRVEAVLPAAPGVVSDGDRHPVLEDLWARFTLIARWVRLQTDFALISPVSAATPVTTFDLDALVDEVMAESAPRAELHGWQLSSYRHPVVLGPVHADRRLVGAVLTHLLGASVDAAAGSESPSQVQCKFSVVGDSLHIDVIDNGAGLSQETLDRWFKDWDLGQALPSADTAGLTGWRLVLVRELVRREGGRFDARSASGHGSRWSADLPLVRAHVAERAG